MICKHDLPISAKCRQCFNEAMAAEALMSKKRPKHHNKKTVIDGVKFDSGREAKRWGELKLLERAGRITGLAHQVPFVLVPAVVLDGRKKPAVKYIADFEYMDGARRVIEDAKSPHLRKDPVYRIKKHLMMSVHGLAVIEI